MKKFRRVIWTMVCFLLLTFSGAVNVEAAAVDEAVEIFKECHVYGWNMESIEDKYIVVKWKYMNNFTTDSDHGDYSNPYIDIQGFEIQACIDENYPEEKVETYTMTDYADNVESADYSYQIPVSVLGKNGGKLYVRIRAYGKIKKIEGFNPDDKSTELQVGDVVYSDYQNLSCWGGSYFGEESMERYYGEYVKISKDNFGGMYSLMKNGYYFCDSEGKKSYYDKNRDGWLDPSEVRNITAIFNYKYMKSENSNTYEMLYKTNEYQCKISGLDGLRYLPWVSAIQIRDYTSKKMDLSEYPHIRTVSIRELWQSKIQLIAPYAKDIDIQSETGGSWSKAKLSSIDVSNCTAVVHLSLGGSYFKYMTAELPDSAKNLKWISLSYDKNTTVNLNKYKNINLAYFYSCNFSKCNMDKCTKLNYAYFYCTDQVKSVNLKNSKNLKGVDIYHCEQLTSSGIKTVKNTKITKNKGRWWETTKDWEKLINDIYKAM